MVFEGLSVTLSLLILKCFLVCEVTLLKLNNLYNFSCIFQPSYDLDLLLSFWSKITEIGNFLYTCACLLNRHITFTHFIVFEATLLKFEHVDLFFIILPDRCNFGLNLVTTKFVQIPVRVQIIPALSKHQSFLNVNCQSESPCSVVLWSQTWTCSHPLGRLYLRKL